MKFWNVEIDIEQGEEVIIDSAEQRGIVKEMSIDTMTKEVMYYVEFADGAVYTPMLGYNSNWGWFWRRELRKIEPKYHVWTVTEPEVYLGLKHWLSMNNK